MSHRPTRTTRKQVESVYRAKTTSSETRVNRKSFIFYLKSSWKKIIAQQPNMRITRSQFRELTRDIAVEWRKLPCSTKQNFDVAYERGLLVKNGLERQLQKNELRRYANGRESTHSCLKVSESLYDMLELIVKDHLTTENEIIKANGQRKKKRNSLGYLRKKRSLQNVSSSSSKFSVLEGSPSVEHNYAVKVIPDDTLATEIATDSSMQHFDLPAKTSLHSIQSITNTAEKDRVLIKDETINDEEKSNIKIPNTKHEVNVEFVKVGEEPESELETRVDNNLGRSSAILAMSISQNVIEQALESLTSGSSDRNSTRNSNRKSSLSSRRNTKKQSLSSGQKMTKSVVQRKSQREKAAELNEQIEKFVRSGESEIHETKPEEVEHDDSGMTSIVSTSNFVGNESLDEVKSQGKTTSDKIEEEIGNLEQPKSDEGDLLEPETDFTANDDSAYLESSRLEPDDLLPDPLTFDEPELDEPLTTLADDDFDVVSEKKSDIEFGKELTDLEPASNWKPEEAKSPVSNETRLSGVGPGLLSRLYSDHDPARISKGQEPTEKNDSRRESKVNFENGDTKTVSKSDDLEADKPTLSDEEDEAISEKLLASEKESTTSDTIEHVQPSKNSNIDITKADSKTESYSNGEPADDEKRIDKNESPADENQIQSHYEIITDVKKEDSLVSNTGNETIQSSQNELVTPKNLDETSSESQANLDAQKNLQLETSKEQQADENLSKTPPEITESENIGSTSLLTKLSNFGSELLARLSSENNVHNAASESSLGVEGEETKVLEENVSASSVEKENDDSTKINFDVERDGVKTSSKINAVLSSNSLEKTNKNYVASTDSLAAEKQLSFNSQTDLFDHSSSDNAAVDQVPVNNSQTPLQTEIEKIPEEIIEQTPALPLSDESESQLSFDVEKDGVKTSSQKNLADAESSFEEETKPSDSKHSVDNQNNSADGSSLSLNKQTSNATQQEKVVKLENLNLDEDKNSSDKNATEDTEVVVPDTYPQSVQKVLSEILSEVLMSPEKSNSELSQAEPRKSHSLLEEIELTTNDLKQSLTMLQQEETPEETNKSDNLISEVELAAPEQVDDTNNDESLSNAVEDSVDHDNSEQASRSVMLPDMHPSIADSKAESVSLAPEQLSMMSRESVDMTASNDFQGNLSTEVNRVLGDVENILDQASQSHSITDSSSQSLSITQVIRSIENIIEEAEDMIRDNTP